METKLLSSKITKMDKVTATALENNLERVILVLGHQ